MSTSPYNEAGKILNQILTEHKSLKTIAFSTSKHKKNKNGSGPSCSKTAYAQVCRTLQHRPILESILNHDNSKLRKKMDMDSIRNVGLFYVLLYELLFGKYGSIRGGGRLKRSIMKFEGELREVKESILTKRQQDNGGGKGGGGRMPAFPRYIRVNTLKITTEEAVRSLKKDLLSKSTEKENDDTDSDTKQDIMYMDPHMPDVLVTSPKTSVPWHENELVRSSKIILQDKSSCFSALALVLGSTAAGGGGGGGGDYIDACASPGNKTTHLAALIHKLKVEESHSTDADATANKATKKKNRKKKKKVIPPKIFAVDRASSRISILKDRLGRLVPKSEPSSDEVPPPEVVPIHKDFLKMDPEDETFKNVGSILLDPSCSGSGIVNALDNF